MSNGSSFPKINPIPTIYRGFKFRSRIEARYAVFFDWLQVPWEYEKEGYVVDGTPYLPDFWLPGEGLHIEIKGSKPTEKERNLAHGLALLTGKASLIFHDLPGWKQGYANYWPREEINPLRKLTEEPVDFGYMDSIGKLCFLNDTVDDAISYADSELDYMFILFNSKFCVEHLKSEFMRCAMWAARQARFEHGENPAPSWMH